MRNLDPILKHLLAPLVLTVVSVGISLAFSAFETAFIIGFVGLFWASLMIYRTKDRYLDYSIRTEQRKMLELGRANKEVVDRVSRVQVKHSIATNNIAGTLVRTANLLKSGAVGSCSPDNAVKEAVDSAAGLPISNENVASETQGINEPNVFDNLLATPVKALPGKVTFPEIRVAIVADEFTEQAFSYEWETVVPKRSNWKSVIDEFSPDFLFVESAWLGGKGDWQYQLVGQSAPRTEIKDLVAYCKSKAIPTVFWNKEDPPHFEDFLDTAKLFDFVFTTEGALIEEYKRRLGHSNVYLLPFAAQPRIHNPARIRGIERNRDIVFGGMYFRDKYPERREQMDFLLPSAMRLGLDIYSRQDGRVEKYRFPGELSNRVLGSLPYPSMLAAYHAYKVVINVNSVANSETMCARRIFEATAAGAAVVSAPTPAIDKFFPNGMLTTATDLDNAYDRFRGLLRSDEYRQRKVHVAQRHIWENHTYSNRARTILNAIGILPAELEAAEEVLYSVFVSTNRPDNVELIFQNFKRQTYQNKQLVILTHGFEVNKGVVENLLQKYDIDAAELEIIPGAKKNSLGKNLNELTRRCDGAYLFRMDDDDYYGPNYIRDLGNILKVTGADLAGKNATYIYFEEANVTVLTFPGKEHRFTDFVRGATFCGPKETFLRWHFPEESTGEDSSLISKIKKDRGIVYAADRFNFAVMRHTEKSDHTWTVDDDNLFATGEMKFVGFDPRQVNV